MLRRHGLVDFQAHDRRETLFAQLFGDHFDQIVGLLFVAGQRGVACDPERVGGHDLHALEERVQVVDDDLFQRHEVKRIVERHPTWPVGRHLDAGKERLFAHRIA